MLVLPHNAPSPTRVIIHWTDEAARRATLAVAASLLRHVSAEAVYLGIVPEGRPGAQRPAPMRALLDARSEAQQTHGLEMRTELAIGETVTELTRNLSAGSAQMLVLGITDITHAGSAYRSLLAAQPGWPVLIVYRPAETRARARTGRIGNGGMKNVGKREPNVIPGFGITLGFTTFFLSAIVLLPLSAMVLKTAGLDWSRFVEVIASPRALASYRLSFGASLVAASVNMVFGFALAWTLVRYDFPGRKLVDAIIDMPFALPTAVSGIALATIFAANGWIGQYLEPRGIFVAYTPLGITVALTLIGMPFVVRTVQPASAGSAARPRRRRRDARRRTLLCLPPHHRAHGIAGAAHRIHARLRARRG